MMNQEEIIRKQTISSKSTSEESSVVIVNEESSTINKRPLPMDNDDSDLRLKLYKSKVNGIVSQALGKKGEPQQNQPENDENIPKSPETELRLRLYRNKIREIVARALGKELPADDHVDQPNEFENQEEIKTKTQTVIMNKSVKEESTVMTVESSETISSSSTSN